MCARGDSGGKKETRPNLLLLLLADVNGPYLTPDQGLCTMFSILPFTKPFTHTKKGQDWAGVKEANKISTLHFHPIHVISLFSHVQDKLP